MSDDDNVVDPGLGPIDPLGLDDDALGVPPGGVTEDEEEDDDDSDIDESA